MKTLEKNKEKNAITKGYKVFNSDWKCRKFQYKVGETYELKLKEGEKLTCCKNGFHFCTKLEDCFNYYSFNPNNKVAEVEALGNVDKDKSSDIKMCTDKIRIVRELNWHEALDMVNEGKYNYGLRNNGKYNYGNHNYGTYNCGDYNYSSHNMGGNNKGCGNIGYYNKGVDNIGNYNVGNYNKGYHNIGDFNMCSYSSGAFCISPTNFFLFGKLSNWTYKDWINSRAYDMLDYIVPEPTEWIDEEDMTEEEKKRHPQYIYIKGYLKVKTEEEIKEEWNDNWNGLSDKDREIIMNIPNFDADIFKEITGIDVRKDND